MPWPTVSRIATTALQVGKPEVGEITVKLVQEGNEIILSMSMTARAWTRNASGPAEAMGLLQPGQAADDATLYDFIFQPGFSTATELTQLAGRGVGMDVVRPRSAELGGRIEIVSEAGKGTTFRLYLPLTLAVTQTLLVRVGNALYAVPSTMIEQVMEMKEKALTAIGSKARSSGRAIAIPSTSCRTCSATPRRCPRPIASTGCCCCVPVRNGLPCWSTN